MPEDRRTLDELKQLGASVKAPDGVALLYRQAFREFGTQSLWNRKPSEDVPTIAQVLVIADSLRREGNMQTRDFAAQIEEACRAAL